MSRITLTGELENEYRRLFATCVLREERAAEVDECIDAILTDRDRYQAVGESLQTPWFVVAALHVADTGRDFTVHLHNGDPLTDRTQHVPAGRPLVGEPPFRWEDSAIDALSLNHFGQWSDWSIAGTLFKLEGRGGWGYRLHHPDTPSPYLWSYSTYYRQGKYVTDETWSETAVAVNCGVGMLLRRMAERELIQFSDASNLPVWPLLCYDETQTSPWVVALQRILNTLPGIFIKVDGRAGPKTSKAFHRVTGRYLLGDPRTANES
jgi:lysozyme family protein